MDEVLLREDPVKAMHFGRSLPHILLHTLIMDPSIVPIFKSNLDLYNA